MVQEKARRHRPTLDRRPTRECTVTSVANRIRSAARLNARPAAAAHGAMTVVTIT
jgi:hypothetical protein